MNRTLVSVVLVSTLAAYALPPLPPKPKRVSAPARLTIQTPKAAAVGGYVVPPGPKPFSLTLAWTPGGGTNVVTNFFLYWGPQSRTYTNHLITVATNATVTNLVRSATYFFAATAKDNLNQESPYSNEAQWPMTNMAVRMTTTYSNEYGWIPWPNLYVLYTNPPGSNMFKLWWSTNVMKLMQNPGLRSNGWSVLSSAPLTNPGPFWHQYWKIRPDILRW